ncbi:MAG TPA: enterochelin esterase, partial [Dongiaceae bacterium]
MRKNRNLPQGDIRRLEIDSKALAGNLLGDPSRRDLYVYLPPGFKAGDHPPLLVDLVGFTGSGQSHISWKNF